MHARTVRLAVAAVASAALATACGSSGTGTVQGDGGTGGGKSSPQAVLAAAASKTYATDNSKVHFEFKGSADGKAVDFGGDGIIDFTGQKFALKLDLPGVGGFSGSIEERVVDKVVYIKLPAAATSAAGGRSWVKIDASTLGASSSSSQLTQDPTEFLKTLDSVSDSVTKVGTEEIRGVETTHYRAEIDLTKAVQAGSTKVDPAELTKLQQELKKTIGKDTLPEDVYIDSDGRARRIAVTITPAAGSTGTASVGTFTTTVDLFDFGKADTSSIVAPPASEVGDLSGGLFGLHG